MDEGRARKDGPLSLEAFIDVLSAMQPRELTHATLLDALHRLEPLAAHIERRIRFADAAYTRNLVLRTPEFELLVLCWRPGQHSTIHDHGGSLNAIKVHRGELTSRLFTPAHGSPPQARGPVVLREREVARAGRDVVGIDRDGIHQLANEADEPLVTMHVYAPPLVNLTVYREDAEETQLLPLRYTLNEDLA